MVIAIRSLIEPPGLRNSSLASTVAAPSGITFCSRTSGVRPTSSSSVGYSRAIGGKRNGWLRLGRRLRRLGLDDLRGRPPQGGESPHRAGQRDREEPPGCVLGPPGESRADRPPRRPLALL